LGPTDFGIDQTSASTDTVTVTGIDVPANGLVVMGAAQGDGGLTATYTAPLIERTNGPDPTSADLVTASAIESSVQTNKTYVTDFGAVTFNRGTAIVAVWPKVVTDPPPTVSSVAPSSGPTAGGTAVTITGTDFVSGATVTFGGTAATGVTVVNATTITATTAAHAVGAVDVVVTNPDTQSGTLTDGYVYTDSSCEAPNVCWDGGGTTNNWSRG
jgi:hypothetical protein